MAKEKDREKDNADSKNESIKENTAVKDISDKVVNVESLDPETLEVEKLIAPDDEKDEPMEVPNYEEEIVKIIRGNSSPKLLKSKLEDYFTKPL